MIENLQEELRVTAHNSLQKRVPVGRLLWDGLTEGEGVAASIGGGEV